MIVGVLALQGDVREHTAALETAWKTLRRETGGQSLKVEHIKSAHQMNHISGLVLPGGESTVMETLLRADPALLTAIDSWLATDTNPTLGTCAGLVLMSRRGLHCSTTRNAYGPQSASFRASVHMAVPAGSILHGAGGASRVLKDMPFIRAPRIADVREPASAVAWRAEEPVAVRQGAMLGCVFHPELTDETCVHTQFLRDCLGYANLCAESMTDSD